MNFFYKWQFSYRPEVHAADGLLGVCWLILGGMFFPLDTMASRLAGVIALIFLVTEPLTSLELALRNAVRYTQNKTLLYSVQTHTRSILVMLRSALAFIVLSYFAIRLVSA